MDIFILNEENHGFLGCFSSLEKAIEGAKKWSSMNTYEIEEYSKNSWEIDFGEDALMTVDKITLDKLEH